MNASLLELARQHALLLAVIAPFIGAALAVVAGHARVSWAISVLAAICSAMLAIDAGQRALINGAPIADSVEGIALRADGVALFAAAWIAGALAVTTIAAGAFLRQLNPRVAPLGLALVLCAGGGWIGALYAQDWLGLIAAASTAWIASVALAAFGAERDRAALNGAMRMLGAGGVACALLFFGAGLIGRGAGSLEIAALESARIFAPGLTLTGVGLILAGLAIQAGIAPLHLWGGAAFGRGGAWMMLTAGVIGIAGALTVIVRVAAHAMAAPAIASGVAAGLVALGAISALIGSMQAIGARSLPRLAAYAFAAQAGCVLISAALGSQAGIAAALVQALAIISSAIALFVGSAVMGGAQSLHALDGVGRRAPLAGAAITAGALGLMGAPLTITFLGRWRMIEAAVGVGWWWAACIAIAALLAGVFYGGRLVERVYFRRSSAVADAQAGDWCAAPALITAICITLLGVEPSLLLRAVGAAGAMIMGGAP